VVDGGRSARAAISVNVLRLSSATASRMALTLLITERPGVLALPAMADGRPACCPAAGGRRTPSLPT
jgi:hypothetical protein